MRVINWYGSCLMLASIIALAAIPVATAQTSDPFYVISHMANNHYSIDWSVQQGANAIENDIQFDGSGRPTKFEHGGVCDCICTISDHICGPLRGSCTANDDASGHLTHIARFSQISLVLMDSKVDSKWGSRLRTAGTNVVDLLDRSLFGAGYQGSVVVSAGKINSFDYVYSAALAAANSRYRNRYYFSFDQESDNYRDVVAMLSRFTNNRVFGTGISSCAPGDYASGISQAVQGVRNGEIGMSYIWTLDKESSMERYINLGVHGIITNRPGVLRNLALRKGLRLANSGTSIPVARVYVNSPNKCDCDYHSGGCTISFPAPKGQACRCKYKGWWTCGGGVVGCNWGNDKCREPDASIDACQLGGGDCGGY